MTQKKSTSENVAKNFVNSGCGSLSSFITHETGIFVDGYGQESCYDLEGLDNQAFGTCLSLSVASDSYYKMLVIRRVENNLRNKHTTPVKKPGKKSRKAAEVTCHN